MQVICEDWSGGRRKRKMSLIDAFTVRRQAKHLTPSAEDPSLSWVDSDEMLKIYGSKEELLKDQGKSNAPCLVQVRMK